MNRNTTFNPNTTMVDTLNDPQLNIIYFNASGLRNKYTEFINFLESHSIHIALVNETWLGNEIKLRYSHKYKIYRYDRIGLTRGGVAIVIRRDIKHKLLPINESLHVIEAIGISVQSEIGEFKLWSTYFAGKNSPHIKNICMAKYNNVENSTISRAFSHDINVLTNFTCSTYICGDLNAKHSNWNCVRANTIGNTLSNIVRNSSSIKLFYPQDPTYVPLKSNSSPSTLDIVLTNCTNVQNIKTMTNLSSDHLPVHFEIPIKAIKSIPNPIFIYKDANWSTYAHEINQKINISRVAQRCHNLDNENTVEIDNLVREFTQILLDARNLSVPRRQKYLCYQSNVILTDEILDLKRLRNSIRRQWNLYHNQVDKHNIKILNKIISNKISEQINSNFSQFLQQINEENSNDHNRKLWRLAKSLKNKTVYPPLKKIVCVNNSNIQEVMITNEEKAECLAQQFVEAHHTTSNMQHTQIDEDEINSAKRLLLEQNVCHNLCRAQMGQETINLLVTPAEIKNIVKQLKLRKAPGLDEIDNLMIKKFPPKAYLYLTYVMNTCLKFSYFPVEWKKAKTVAILKPKTPNYDPSSYRPISLLSSLGKIFEKVVHNRIRTCLELLKNANINVIPNHQFGFRMAHSCNHQIKRLINHIKNKRQQMKSTGVIALDIEKAFDCVWHDKLITKMIKMEFPLPIVKLIQSFLKNRKFCVHLQNGTSQQYNIPAGVPQGSSLSPTLYNLYVADIPTPTGCELATFADDTVIYSSGIEAENILQNLQNGYHKLQEYFTKNKIKINNEKTNATYFTRRRARKYVPQRNLILNNRVAIYPE